MTAKTLTLLATTAALAAAPAVANAADQVVTAAPNASNLASGGGYLAWATAVDGGGYQLTVRAPNGTVSTPDIPKFARAPRTSIGSTYLADRKLVAVYDRGGDLYQLDLAAGTETKVAKASTSATESSPVISYGRIAFVRSGAKGGVFLLDHGKVRRVATAKPSLLGYNGSRIAYPSSKGIVLHKVSGHGRDSYAKRTGAVRDLQLSRYSVTWLQSGGKLFRTTRFGGSGTAQAIHGIQSAKRTLPASTSSFATDGSFTRYYLDAEGVKKIPRGTDIFPH